MTTRVIQVHQVPTITIFVRHSGDCPRRGDEFYKSCRCPKHLRWSYGGKQFRQAAKTRTWSIAEQVRRKIEAQYEAADPTKPIDEVTVAARARPDITRAVELFVSSKRSQGLEDGVLKKYDRELGRFTDFMGERARFFPHEITLEDLTEFRANWTN